MPYFQSISIIPLIYVDGPYEVHPLLRINLPNPLKKGSRVISLYHLFSYILDDDFRKYFIKCRLGIQQQDKQRLLGRVNGELDCFCEE